nr:immunoglobulin light chain junction region [Macaca mulatta]
DYSCQSGDDSSNHDVF